MDGLNGTVSITTPDLNYLQGITDVPNDLIQPEQNTMQACPSDRLHQQQPSTLAIQGKGNRTSLTKSKIMFNQSIFHSF